MQLDLEGDSASLLALGEALKGADFVVSLIDVPAAPYDGTLRTLETRVTAGPVSIQHDGQAVTITGGAEQVAQLGRNVCLFAEHADTSDPADHLRLEHIRDSDHYIAANSVPLVVGLLDPVL